MRDHIKLVASAGGNTSVRYDYPPVFYEFWSVYPRRNGSNPKYPAFQLFNRFVERGVDPQWIIRGAANYAA
jgi:hypothetical protein